MLLGMRYAQKFFRINFKFYKFLLGSLRSKSFKNRFKNLSLPMLGGMRYAQKFFRINFKFYKFLFGGRGAQNRLKIVLKIIHFIILKNLFLICQISARRASEK